MNEFTRRDSLMNSVTSVLLGESFFRLPGHVIGNELYVVNRALATLASSQMDGNDYDPKQMTVIIKKLQDIHKQAKAFTRYEDVPVSYQYTSKGIREEDETIEEAAKEELELLKSPKEAKIGDIILWRNKSGEHRERVFSIKDDSSLSGRPVIAGYKFGVTLVSELDDRLKVYRIKNEDPAKKAERLKIEREGEQERAKWNAAHPDLKPKQVKR